MNGLQYTHIIDMGSHMKTTIEVSDALFDAAKQLARKKHVTMRALIEDGLRHVLNNNPAIMPAAFKLADASVKVKGGKMLVADPNIWHQLEEEHVASNVAGRRHDRR